MINLWPELPEDGLKELSSDQNLLYHLAKALQAKGHCLQESCENVEKELKKITLLILATPSAAIMTLHVPFFDQLLPPCAQSIWLV